MIANVDVHLIVVWDPKCKERPSEDGEEDEREGSVSDSAGSSGRASYKDRLCWKFTCKQLFVQIILIISCLLSGLRRLGKVSQSCAWVTLSR